MCLLVTSFGSAFGSGLSVRHDSPLAGLAVAPPVGDGPRRLARSHRLRRPMPNTIRLEEP
jgi:hypothetical protein